MYFATIEVKGASAYVKCHGPIPAGIIGAQVEFKFDNIWNGRHKTIVFRTPHVTKDVILSNGTSVIIPSEVVAEPCLYLHVGVYGTDNETALPTLWVNLGSVYAAADPSGDTSTDPTLPVWAQLEHRITKLEESDSSTGGGSGLSSGAAALLITILQATQCEPEQSENIKLLAAMLGIDLEEEPNEPDAPDIPDVPVAVQIVTTAALGAAGLGRMRLGIRYIA